MRRIALALQGGGAHGAFTWGVLDRLLADDTIAIEALSGTSAGAMNAIVAADGLVRGGREGARLALARFWQAVGDAARFSPLRRTALDALLGGWTLERSPGYRLMDIATRLVSPYDANPLDINPLREIVRDLVDFDAVNRCDALKVFVTATDVRTGLPAVFRQPDITLDHVMASACLPLLFKAVEIDGEAYWDGGFTGNPSLEPLIEADGPRDLVIVQINPLVRGTVPRDAHAIRTRVNEICFNASLVKELRALALLQRLAEAADMPKGRYRELRVHRIHAEEDMARLDASSKLNAEPAFLAHLRGIGIAAAERFLTHHRADLGVRSTYALDAPSPPASPDAPPPWRGVSAARALGARLRALLARRVAPMSGAAPR